MDLYFSPLACSMAARIALYEAAISASFCNVTLATKRVDDQLDYLAVTAKGTVPALRMDDGELLTEGPAILQYIADLRPDAELAPAAGTFARYRLQEWLNYLSTELHRTVFHPIFNPGPPEAARMYARQVLDAKFDYVSFRLANSDYLLDRFSVADAYLFTILNWTFGAQVDLKKWPVLIAYFGRIKARPNVAQAWGEEMRLAGRA
jgi:glutathione S-transferase